MLRFGVGGHHWFAAVLFGTEKRESPRRIAYRSAPERMLVTGQCSQRRAEPLAFVGSSRAKRRAKDYAKAIGEALREG